MTSHRTSHKRKNKRQSRAGDGELHSRGRGEVMTALLPGEVSSLVSLGSCLWLMESRDCPGISLLHLNISMCYKCSQKKNEMQEFSGLTRHQDFGFSEMQGWQQADMWGFEFGSVWIIFGVFSWKKMSFLQVKHVFSLLDCCQWLTLRCSCFKTS